MKMNNINIKDMNEAVKIYNEYSIVYVINISAKLEEVEKLIATLAKDPSAQKIIINNLNAA